MQQIAANALNASTIMFFTLGFQFVYAAFYMSVGMGFRSFLLNISRQGIMFIPTILILPTYWGLQGVLYTPMVADFLSVLLTLFYAFKAKSICFNASRYSFSTISLSIKAMRSVSLRGSSYS